jgi:cobalt-zinc-cadmium efflux system membrane fusion protein
LTEIHATPSPALPPGRQWTILAIVALAALLLFFGVPLVGRLFAPKPAPPPAAPPPGTFAPTAEQLASLKIVAVQAMAFRPQNETDGSIAADDYRTTPVFSPYSGRVTRVFAKLGDSVRAGQPLFSIDASEFVQAQSDLVTALAQVKLTQAAEARQRALYAASGAALKDWQQSQADLATAQAGLEAVRNRLRVLGKTDAEIKALERDPPGRAMAAEAVVAAPISGVVTQRTLGVGENLASVANNGGSTPAFSISDLSTVWLVGNLREADAPHARIGQGVEVRVPALPGRVFTAKVDYVGRSVDPATRRVTVRAEIPNPDGALLPQMFADFSLITGAAATAVGVPAEGVVYEGDQARVWVVRPDNLLALRQIKTGETVDGMVEVVSGLSPGERVVTSGSLFIDRAAKGD